MKTNKRNHEMRAEYDFSKGERGKFYRPLDKGHTAHIHKKDGTVVVNHYELAEGTIMLAPDVAEYFPDSESVNEALRSLIQLIDKVPARKYKSHKSTTSQVAERK
jgi:hypothetical protein